MGIMANIRRLRPAFSALFGSLSFGAIRDYIWDDLRKDVIKLHDLSPVTRNLVLMGFALLFAMAGALAFNDVWRAEFPLVPMLTGVPGRGSLLPIALIPATLFLLSVAWSFMLAGALRARRSIRIGALLLYMVLAVSWTGINNPTIGLFGFLLGWGVLLAVPIFFVISRWTRSQPALEFSVLLLLVSATFAFTQLQAVGSWRESGTPIVFASINSTVLALSILTVPLLLFVGMDVAESAYRASGWVSGIAASRLPRRVLAAVLLGAFAWRLFEVGAETIAGSGAPAAYAGALGIPLIVGLVWWVVTRYEAGESSITVERTGEVAKKAALPLILAYLGVVGLSIALLFTAEVLGVTFGATSGGADRALKLGDQVLSRFSLWLVVVDALAVVAAYWVLRRGGRVLALYLGILGAGHFWIQVTDPGRFLEFLGWTGPEPVDFWWVVVFAITGLIWLLGGHLTPERMQGLLFVLVITALLRQAELIADPFSPFFGLAGAGIIALGIIWDSLTAGSWTNRDSAGLPRPSRIFLYLGYVLFSVAVINWVVAAHDLSQTSFFTGEAALRGLDIFGRPMLYAIFAITLALPPAESEEDDEPEDGSEDGSAATGTSELRSAGEAGSADQEPEVGRPGG